MSGEIIVLVTSANGDEASKIAEALVRERLAACVNIAPQIESVYRWQGEVETATEWLLLIKTTAGAFHKVREALGKLHSYDLPECIEIKIENGSAGYLDWIGSSVGGSQSSD